MLCDSWAVGREQRPAREEGRDKALRWTTALKGPFMADENPRERLATSLELGSRSLGESVSALRGPSGKFWEPLALVLDHIVRRPEWPWVLCWA